MNSIGKFARHAALLLVVALVFAASAFAADATGTWTSTFSTQIGDQHYTYTLKQDGEKLTGKAKNDMGETEIKDGSVKGDTVTFTEALSFNGNDITITYTGKIDGDQIKFTRKVGDFATEELVAKREK